MKNNNENNEEVARKIMKKLCEKIEIKFGRLLFILISKTEILYSFNSVLISLKNSWS